MWRFRPPDKQTTGLAPGAGESGAGEGPYGVSGFSEPPVPVPAFGLPRVIVGPGELGLSGAHDEYCEIENLHAAARIFRRITTLSLNASAGSA